MTKISERLLFYLCAAAGSVFFFLPLKDLMGISSSNWSDDIVLGTFQSVASLPVQRVMYVSIGIYFPLFVDVVCDVASFDISLNHDIVDRAVLLATLGIPDLLLLFYVIPYNIVNLYGPISIMRGLFLASVTFAHLRSYGGQLFAGKFFLVPIITTYLGCFCRGLLWLNSSLWLRVIWMLCSNISVCSLLVFNILWFRDIFYGRIKELSGKQIACSFGISSQLLIPLTTFCLFYFGMESNEYKNTVILVHRIMVVAYGTGAVVLSVRRTKMAKIYAERKLEAKRMLVRLVSHEIRTPLSIVMMGLNHLQKTIKKERSSCTHDEALVDEWLSILEDTQTSCDSALEVLNDVLAYEKLDAGLMVLEKATLPVWEFVYNVTRPFNMQALQKGVMLIFEDETAMRERLKEFVLQADKSKLSQVIRNMLSNAIKFTPAGGSVSVRVHVLPSSSGDTSVVRIDVVDTGFGMSKENLGLLFENIVQFDAAKQQEGGGSGIGLWVSKALMDLHGGTISAASKGEGHGCTFTVELPVFLLQDNMALNTAVGDDKAAVSGHVQAPGSAAVSETETSLSVEEIDTVLLSSPDNSASSAGSVSGNRQTIPDSVTDTSEQSDTANESSSPPFSDMHQDTVTTRVYKPSALFVDDVAMCLRMMRHAIGDKFASVEDAKDGVVATERVRASMDSGKPFDVVLMDYQMPRMDGPTAAKTMRDMGYKGVIVGLTGNVLAEDVSYYKSMGADFVLGKPMKEGAIVEVILSLELGY